MKGYVAFGSMLLAFQAARTNRGINPILFKYKAAIALIVFVCWRLLRNSRSSSNHIEAIEVAIKKKRKSGHIDTVLAQAGCEVDDSTGALTPAIHLASTFERDVDLQYSRKYIYSRIDNPTRNLLERCITECEKGIETCAFASGSAAANAVFQCLADGVVIIPDDMYHGNTSLLRDIFQPWGLLVETVDMTDPDTVESVLKSYPDRQVLVWMETPSNPLLKVTDIAKIASISKSYNALTLVDATWLSPALCQPLLLGCNMVLHSSTKYIGGHSDLLGGLLTSDGCEFFQKVRKVQGMCGAVPSPFDCWLTLRGIRSLGVRMERHCDNALEIAKYLSNHPKIQIVYYPGLVSHPNHDVYASQCKDGSFGGMLSFLINGTEKHAIAFASFTTLFKRATSLGGTESLIEHRASVEGPHSKTPRNLIRMSVGLESINDLLDDLKNALNKI